MVKKIKKPHGTIITLCLAAFLFRLAFSPWFAYERDVASWIGWSSRLLEVGFKNFYSQGWCDYLPGYLYLLRFWGQLRGFLEGLNLSLDPFVFYKIPAILADVLTVGLIYLLARRWTSHRSALLASLVYGFNPAILANSTFWGQIDSVNTLFYLLTLAALVENKIVFSALFLAISCLVKPQGIILLPLTAVILLKRKNGKQFFLYYSLFAFLFVVFFLPFLPSKSSVLSVPSFIFSRFQKSLDQYPYTSLNAFNFWALSGRWWQKDSLTFFGLPYQLWGLLLFGAVYAFCLWWLGKKWRPAEKKESTISNLQLTVLVAGIVLAALFLFPTRVHERHLFSLFPFLALAATFLPRLGWAYAGYSLSYLANLAFAYVWLTADFKEIFSPVLVTAFSLFNLGVFIFLIKKGFGYLLGGKKAEEEARAAEKATIRVQKKPLGPKKIFLLQDFKFSQKTKKTLVAVLLLTALFWRFFRLAVPQRLVFDEVYHGFTAGEFAKGNKEAWEWWTTPPPDVAYEWTHPPLAKLLMAGSIKIFGYNSYGWRFAPALIGVAAVAFFFLLGRALFKNFFVAWVSTFLMVFDFMPLVMSRIAMNDVFFVALMLASFYFFVRFLNQKQLTVANLLLAGFFWGGALASKWTAVYAVFVLAPFLLLRLKKSILSHRRFILDLVVYFFSFALLPLSVYLLSYLPFFFQGHSWDQFIHLQKQMWWYHTRLDATHPFNSSWWTWPLDLRPVWLFVDYAGEKIANIYCFGNPFIWWFGLGAIAYLVWRLIDQIRQGRRLKTTGLSFLLLGYFAFFLPWSVSPRIMFIYHYFPSLPFLYLASALVLNQIYFSKSKISLFPLPRRLDPKIAVLAYLIAVGALFILFYPHLTAVQVPKSLTNFYFWLASWR